MFMARGVRTPPDDSMTVDQNTTENNGAEIPTNPAAIATGHGTGVAGDISPATYVVGAQFAPNTTNHRQTTGG